MPARAYSLLEIKSFDDDARTFEGIATTPTTDRFDDIVEPMGAEFKLPIPFLWQHRASEPIGHITAAKATKAGITVRGNIAKIAEPASLKDDLDRAWAMLKSGLVRGLSIGFLPIESAEIDGTFGRRFTKWSWLELSAVTIAANSEATITAIKSIDDTLLRAALGESQRSENRAAPPPGVTGKQTHPTSSRVFYDPNKGKSTMPTIQENIAGFEAKRAANVAAMQALVDASAADGSTMNAEQKEQYKGFKAELDGIDEHLAILREHEKIAVTKATPVAATAGTEGDAAKARVAAGDLVIRPNQNLPKGIGMARYVKAFAFARGNYQQAAEYAKQWETSTPEVALALKTAVSAGTTTDSSWAGPLVYASDFPAAFLDYLRPQTIIGKLTGISMVPFNIRYGIQSTGTTVAWVGQGAPKPVSKPTFTSGSLGFAKAAGIVVITQELARFSSPAAEVKIRDDLAAQMVQFLDAQFIDPSVAAVSNVSPASVLNGASNVRQAAAAWTSMANVLTDVKALLTTFAANEISLQGAYWVMTPDAALTLSMLLTTGGENFAFPDISVNGGTFLKLPVIVSNGVPHSTSAGSIVALIVPQHIYMADDGGVAIDTSTEASINMDDAPTVNSATPTATSLVSMFQTNSIAIRVERVINWARARNYGVGYIDNMHTS